MSGPPGQRKQFARGQQTRGANSGPAVMLMPPHIRATFMPNPPLPHWEPQSYKRRTAITGISGFMGRIQAAIKEDKNKEKPAAEKTPHEIKAQRKRLKAEEHERKLQPLIEKYRKMQKECGGELDGMNCYNVLFVGRLAYEVTERKLLREMEAFGPIKDIKIVTSTSNDTANNDNSKKSHGIAFVEYEHEDDMKRAYRAADGMRIEGRPIVVDVERGHTVPTWLPRRLGGGLGGTRLGGKELNVTRPGRYDPASSSSRGAEHNAPPMQQQPYPPQSMGRGGGPPPPMYGGGGSMGRGGGGYGGAPPPPGPPPSYGRGGGGGGDRYGGGGGGRDYDRGPGPGRYNDGGHGGGGGGDWDRKRRRSDSPDRRYGGGGGGGSSSRRRY